MVTEGPRPGSFSGQVSSAEVDRAALMARIKRVVRFTLPFFSKVIVVSEGEPDLLDLEGRLTWHLPCTENWVFAGPYPRNSAAAIEQIERLRAQYGAQFLLVPSTSFWWFDHFDELRRHLSSRYRVVIHEEDTCLIYALHLPEDVGYRTVGAPDSLPVPPPEMIGLTLGFFDSRDFYELGRRGAALIRDVLERHDIVLEKRRSILDFGCGCGRIMRQWKELRGPRKFGVDYNPYLVDWCRKTLGFAKFELARMPEGLTYDDDSIDLIYSLSVFTHLDPEAQTFWIEELTRILAPGGVVYLTLQGADNISYLNEAEKERFAAGEMVIRSEERSGSSSCVVYHPETYVREELAKGFEILGYLHGGAEDMGAQDIVLLRKPDG
jgi:SAM-dependent methyltransferase